MSGQHSGRNDVKNVQASRDVKAKLASSSNQLVLTDTQRRLLEENFQTYGRGRNMDEITLQLVAAEAGLRTEDAEKWFQNRKALWRKNEGLSPNDKSLWDN
ncbi:homeodomain-only protein-like [Amphiura filiformis]|uniref:homeodomain-only protein-like n=1 Tax=Amphiura filiformis TaxID=82378 RepID=UPI003B21237D